MRWNKPNLRNSLHGLLGRDAPASTSWVRNHGLEEVRHAMIECLVGLSGSDVARMNMRLRYASDIEALWYLRSDLRTLLVPLRGEALAHATLTQLTPLFQGSCPARWAVVHRGPQAIDLRSVLVAPVQQRIAVFHRQRHLRPHRQHYLRLHMAEW
ncbi:hypothetical protein [Acidovorax carolinensis]|uniref:hypothetical protein n=1 Tax=Acidovorax carolinensis TaxID=553814 RepID=UPI001F42F049|nr:hypothetical protein [Acidovorax carolinensis]